MKKDKNGPKMRQIVLDLIHSGFMVDFAQEERGPMFRAVVNRETRKETIDGLIKAIEEKAGHNYSLDYDENDWVAI